MIAEIDRKQCEISTCAKRVLLFGSSLNRRESRDIDIAVEGILPKDFFSYYGDLMLSLSKPVDIIDISNI